MNMSGKKRNFTLQEKNLLIIILKEYKQIIESKKTDNISAAAKKHAWNKIADQYNASTIATESASGDQLRRLWMNLKSRQRESLTKERQYRLATGGGNPCPDAKINPDIVDIAPALLVEIPNAIDSDSIGNVEPTSPNLLSFTTSWEISKETPTENVQLQTSSTESSQSQASITTSHTIHPQPSTTQSSQSQASITTSHTIHPQPSTTQLNQSQPSIVTQVLQPQSSQSQLQNQPHISTYIWNPEEYSQNEKKLRVQILTKEHMNRERRANVIHELQIKHLEETHEIELQIMKEKLKESKARAELAQRNLCPEN